MLPEIPPPNSNRMPDGTTGISPLDWWLCGASLRSPFANFRFGIPETGSIWDGDRFAESISRLHRRQGGKMD
jgi:hypothetical protein